MRHEICPACHKDIRFNEEAYCPYCGALVTLTARETISRQLELFYAQAKSAMQQGERRIAIKRLIDILSIDPGYRDAPQLLSINRREQERVSYEQRARYYCGLKQWERARQCYHHILELFPEDEHAAVGLRRVDKLEIDQKQARKKRGLLGLPKVWLYILGVVLLLITLLVISGLVILVVNLLS